MLQQQQLPGLAELHDGLGVGGLCLPQPLGGVSPPAAAPPHSLQEDQALPALLLQPERLATAERGGDITLHHITSHYITLHYIKLHYTTLHYITLHYVTLRYITLHCRT